MGMEARHLGPHPLGLEDSTLEWVARGMATPWEAPLQCRTMGGVDPRSKATAHLPCRTRVQDTVAPNPMKIPSHMAISHMGDLLLSRLAAITFHSLGQNLHMRL